MVFAVFFLLLGLAVLWPGKSKGDRDHGPDLPRSVR